MRRAIPSAGVLLSAVLWTGMAAASEPEIMPLVEAGQYREAAAKARALGDPECLALGAGAMSVYGAYVATRDQRRGAFEEALELARMAKDAVAGNAAGDSLLGLVRFQEGQALGRLAESLPREDREQHAGAVRDAFEAALSHDPQRWEAHTGLANWHAKVMVTADDEAGLFGALGANLIYDASNAEAEEHRAAAAAIAKPPTEEKVFLLESAQIRLLIDPEDNAVEAARDLEASLAIEPPNHLGTMVDRRAADCLADIPACADRLHGRVLE